jgi:hypothetical protein
MSGTASAVEAKDMEVKDMDGWNKSGHDDRQHRENFYTLILE